MGPLIPLALSIAPELARWLFGSDAAKTTTAVSSAIVSATGTSDADAAAAKLQQDSTTANELRLELARIAAACDEAARAGDADPRTPSAPATWSAPVISTVVLLTFGAVMGTILRFGMPAGAETAVNMLLGTLAAMATSVVSYWVGSSAGSARKDERLAQAGK